VRIAGNYTFDAPREEVWSALNDPEVLARTIPGCQRLDQVGENEYESTLKVGLQAVRGTYNGRVKIDNLVPPESYEIHVDGKGSNGFLKGNGGIKLREDGDKTILDYGGEAQVGGTIASVGQRLLDGAAKTLINQSLKALAQQIEERRNPSPPVSEADAQRLPPPAARPAAAAGAATPESAEAPMPTAPAGAVESAPEAWERRTITVPPGQGLSEADVARGAVEDLLKERPWLPLVLLAFVIGYLLGRRK
jgi:carbon monoxide dehydrogenase subunit G